jgi:predicted dehydrogenase
MSRRFLSTGTPREGCSADEWEQNVNIVYVGTMNISHYDDTKLALEAGKHCLLEKVNMISAVRFRSSYY